MVSDRFSAQRESAREAGRSAYQVALDVILTGIVVIVPLVVTIYILDAALGIIAGALRPFVQLLEWAGLIQGIKRVGFVDLLITAGIYRNVVEFLTTIIAVLVLVAVVVGVGTLARFRYGERLIDYFDWIIGAIPAVGSIYQSFRQMGEVMLESGVENFRSVKLVEFPFDDVYVLGFETNDSAAEVMAAAGNDDMVILFLPLAPNPVMGGFLTHIPRERTMDVDMTVEEAVQTIITSGIAVEEAEADAVPDAEFRELTDEERAELSGDEATDGEA